MLTRGRRCMVSRQVGLALAALALTGAAVDRACAAADLSGLAGPWTLSSNLSHNQCRLVLRTESAFGGHALSLPPACVRAAPKLKQVKAWSSQDPDAVSLDDSDGLAAVAFTRQATGEFRSSNDMGEVLTLTSSQHQGAASSQDGGGSIVTLAPTPASAATAAEPLARTAVATASTVAAKPRTPGEVAGNYAVMRGDRDTGCMVVLDTTRGGEGMLKARLAPACRDAGIMIFDPLGWQLQAGGIVLKARKGHTIRLDQKDNNVWVKMPEDVKALGLKRL